MLITLKIDYSSIGKHLNYFTKAQIDALVIDYRSNQYSVSELVEKYHLNVYANQLFQELPLYIVNKRCPYDNNYLKKRLKAKYAPKYAKNEAFCTQCYHQNVSDCHCKNCQNYRKDKDLDKKYLALQRFIANQYKSSMIDIKHIDMKDIFYLSILIKYFNEE